MKSFSSASLALLATLAPAAAQSQVLPYLPKDTIVAVAVPDLRASMTEFAQMPLARMWAEPDVQTFFADVKEMLGKKWQEGLAHAKEAHAQGEMPVDPELLLKLRVQGGTFALTRLDLTTGEHGPQPEIGMLLHLDFGDSADAWRNLIERGLTMLEEEAGDDLRKQESKVGDVVLRSFAPPAEAGTRMAINVAFTGNGVVVGTLEHDVRETLAAMQAQTPMLGAAENYHAVAQRLPTAGAEVEMYVQPGPIVDFGLAGLRIAADMGALGGVDVAGVERALAAMGARELGVAGMTSSYVDGKCVTRAFSTFGATRGETATVKTLDTSFLRWVPKDAVGFGAGMIDAMTVHDTLLRGLRAYDEKFAERMLEQLGQMEQQLGFSVRDDFFGAFGDHYITWSMPMGTISSPPETAFLVKVTDEQKLVKVMKNLAKLTNGMVEIEEGDKRGVKAYTVRVNVDPTQGMGGMNVFDMIQPTFSFKDGYMVAGFSASDVKRVFGRMDRKDDDGKNDIRGNKEFAAVAATIPAGVTSLSFTDWKSNFESLYQVATGLLAFVPLGDEVPINMSLLPDSGTLTKHLFAAVSYTKTDANGTESVAVSPFGPEVAMLLGAAVAAGVTMFAGMRGGF